MDRKAFTQKLALLGVCPFVIQDLSGSEPAAESVIQDDKLQALQSQKRYYMNAKIKVELGDVQKTLFMPVWARAVETKGPIYQVDFNLLLNLLIQNSNH